MSLLDYYWTIVIEVNEFKPSLSVQQMRDGLYLSPHVKLSGFPSMAHIESEQLAKEYLKACSPIFEKRYKHGYEAEVQKKLCQQLQISSESHRERLRNNSRALKNTQFRPQ